MRSATLSPLASDHSTRFTGSFSLLATRHFFIVAALVLLLARCAFSLDPSLDISQYAHNSWKIGGGVANDTTHTIVQTKDGYLWLATETGLRRFDGVRSVLWQPPAGEHLPGREIRDLRVSRDGTLWIGTDKGLASWKDGKLTHYPQLDGYDVPTLAEDHEGVVWAAGLRWEHAFWEPGRLCAIKAGNVQCIGSDGIFGFGVTQIHEDSRGNFWLGAANGVWRWKPAPAVRYPFRAGLLGSPTLVFSRNSIIDGEHSGLIIAGYRDIVQFVNGKTEPFPFPSPPPPFKNTTLLRDRDGSLWISSTDVGLAHVHQGRMDFFTDRDGLTSNSIEGMFEDREGSIWVTTNRGIDRFRENTIPTISTAQGLSSRVVLCVLAARDGSVWLGTSDGLNRWKDGRVTVYRKATVRARQNSRTSLGGRVREVISKGLPENFIISLFQDRKGRIWLSTAGGLAYFENGKVSRVAGLPFAPQNPLVEDTAGNLWTAQGDRGLVRLDEGKLAEQIPWTRLGIGGALANPLAADPTEGGVWVGSWGGGVIHFRDGHVRASYGTREGLGGGRVNSLQFDNSGRLWAATDGGLSLIFNGHAITLTSKNGLPCDGAQDVLEDDTHAFWVHMACGVVRIGRGDLEGWVANAAQRVQATVYDASDGVLSHAGVYNFGPRATKTADGKLWFTPVDGVMVVDPHHLPSNPLPPAVEIEQVKGDGEIHWQNLSHGEARKVPVPALTRSLEIDYTGLSFVAPEKVRFKYKLDGYDADWQDADVRRQAIYTNLAPRSYRFRVIACNNSGVWNEEGAALDFVIPPAWYQTNWFRVLCVAAFVALLWALYQLRLRQLARQFNMRLEERVGERTRIARDLHDTLLQSFQGLVFRFQGALNQLPNRPEKAYEVLESALISADQAIAEGRSAIQELRSGSSQESNLEQTLLATGRELASSQNGGDSAPTLRVIVEGTRRAKQAMIREEIYRIARELLRNAYRHAHARSIEAELRYDDAFVLIVRDDGKGIDPQVLQDRGRAGHWGLRGLYERAEGIGARLDVWSEAGAGTEARLTVPGAVAYEKSGDGGRFKLFRKTRIYERRS